MLGFSNQTIADLLYWVTRKKTLDAADLFAFEVNADATHRLTEVAGAVVDAFHAVSLGGRPGAVGLRVAEASIEAELWRDPIERRRPLHA